MENSIKIENEIPVAKVKEYLESMGLIENLSKSEVTRFIEMAQGFKLNPFKREIYAVKFRDNFNIIVGYETYIKRAERTKLLSGWNVTTEGKISDKSLKAKITIHRKDFEFPFEHEVWFCEYQRNSQIWREKPITMIKKVVIAQGFRLCFSDELGGMPYTQEEMDVMDNNIIEKKAKKTKPETKPETKTEGNVNGILKVADVDCIPDDMAEKINSCKSIKPDMIDLWNNHEDLHECKEFKDLFTIKRQQLESEIAKNIEKDIAKMVKPREFTNDDLAEIKNNIKDSSLHSVARAKELISECKTIDEIMELTQGDNRKTILKYAQKQMESIARASGETPPAPVLFSDEIGYKEIK